MREYVFVRLRIQLHQHLTLFVEEYFPTGLALEDLDSKSRFSVLLVVR